MIIAFIKSNYELILTVLSVIVSVVSFVLKHKSNTNNKKILRLISILPAIIDEAESVFKAVTSSGSSKRKYVLEKISVICCELGLSFDEEFWSKKIEEYLSTPSKKNIKEVI